MFTLLKQTVSLLLVVLLMGTGFQAVNAQSGAPFRVYLTFEDGPTDSYTPQILDTLAEYNAKATFFVNGYQVPGRDAILQRIIREGHAIGNHLWEEPGLYSGAADEDVRASYIRTEEAIRAALGDQLPAYDAQVKLFRQPGGGAQPFPQTDGIQVITYNWSVDSDDCGWRLQVSGDESFDQQALDNVLNVPQSADHIYNVYDYGDGVIVAMHDINRVTGRILPVILSELQAAGATFEALPRPWDSLNTMPVALGVPPATGSGIDGLTLPGDVRVDARVRSAPSLDADILIAGLAPQTRITILGRSGDWMNIQVDGQTGWMSADLLKVFGPIPSLPVVGGF